MNLDNMLYGFTPVSAAWDLGTFLQNAKKAIETWGGYFLMLLGVVAVIYSVYQAVKGLMNPQRAQTNWLQVAAAFILGGALTIGGYKWVGDIAQGGKKTIDDLGGGGSAIVLTHDMVRETMTIEH